MTETQQHNQDKATEDQEVKTLSERLREVSFGGHQPEEQQPDPSLPEPRYAKAYLRGGLNHEGIAAQVAQHYLMYEALEAATKAHRQLQGEDFAFVMPELIRLPSLEKDLQYWLGNNWEAQVRGRYNTPRIQNYVDRLNNIAAKSFPHFVAHHYTRYLADLSGGQMIVKMFRESYNMQGLEGTTFYDFEGIDDIKAYKAGYRKVLDSLSFTPEEIELVAKEVALGYQLNNEAIIDLDERFTEYQSA